MPFSIVDGTGFQKFIKETVPLYKLPSRNTIKNLVNTKYNILSNNFKAQLGKTQHFSVTTDVWSEMRTTSSFLGMTAHFIDGCSLESVSLGVVPLEESHTAEYLKSKILFTLNEWNISPNNVCSIVTDNEAAMVKAATESVGNNKHIRCLAHSINLLAESSIKNANGLPDLIKRVREIVKFVKRSVVASDQLREEQRIRGILDGEILKLILDVPTRWNSTYYMIDRFLILSNVVNNILLTKPQAPTIISAVEIENLKEVRSVLAFLEQLTREISGDKYVSASLAIPLLNCLIESINSFMPKLSIGISLKASLQKEFEHRFKEREHAHLLAIAMFLDPRFKNIHFSDPIASSRTLSQIKRLVSNLSPNNASGSTSESDVDSPDTVDLWAHHRSLALKSNTNNLNQNTSLSLDSEISMYLSTPVSSNHKANPLELWHDMKQIYPKLYVLASQYLVSVATSVPAERLFSKAGETISASRNRIGGKLLSKLLFLNGLPDKYWV